MNTEQTVHGHEILETALLRLREHGVAHCRLEHEVVVARRPRVVADARVRLKHEKAEFPYVVEVKATVTKTMLGPLLAQLAEIARVADIPVLLVTRHAAADVAERLRAAGQQFVDLAGNAWLQAPGLLVWVCGRRAEKPLRGTDGRAFTTTGIKVVFALLREPTLAAEPQRAIANAAAVALGGVPAVLGDLRERGYLLGQKRYQRLTGTRRLLDEWTIAYAHTLRPKALRRRLTTTDFEGWRAWDVAAAGALWGGEPAAQLMVGYLRPGALTIYATQLPARFITTHRLRDAPAQTDEKIVEVRTPFWGPTAVDEPARPTVDPLLIYADLLASGDARCIETAAMIRQERLAGLLEEA